MIRCVLIGTALLLSLPFHSWEARGQEISQEFLDAVRQGEVERVRELLDENPEFVGEVDGAQRTALYHAVDFGFREIVELLVSRGSDVNAQDFAGETPLQVAALDDRLELARFLLEKGAETEIRGTQARTALLFVARETGSVEMATLLLDEGAEINLRDAGFETPLDLAAWRGFEALVELFLDRGAEFSATGAEGRKLVRFSADNGLGRLFRTLAEMGAELTIENENGGSLLHSASRSGSAELVRQLLDRGMEVHREDRYGRTPLHYAAERGREEVVEILLAAGADLEARSLAGFTPWNTAGDYDQPEMLRFLEALGAEPTPSSIRDLHGPYLGQTPPGSEPQLFAPDIVSSHRFEHGTVTFSADGTEAFWASSQEFDDSGYSFGRLLSSRQEEGGWSIPTPPPFGTTPRLSDDVPFFSLNGDRLYFISGRSHPDLGGRAERVWYVDRVGNGWSDPEVIMGGPNSLGHHWQFSVSADESVFFSSADPGGQGGGDLYVSRFVNGSYATPQNLGAGVNTEFGEGSPFISPDESYLIFMRGGGPDSFGGVDLYISFKRENGEWTPAVNMGEPINSASNEICPVVTRDGRYFFFNSFRSGNADNYWMDASIIEELKAQIMR
jgi:ankyrin repeat protein